jgi:hypothetical protein
VQTKMNRYGKWGLILSLVLGLGLWFLKTHGGSSIFITEHNMPNTKTSSESSSALKIQADSKSKARTEPPREVKEPTDQRELQKRISFLTRPPEFLEQWHRLSQKALLTDAEKTELHGLNRDSLLIEKSLKTLSSESRKHYSKESEVQRLFAIDFLYTSFIEGEDEIQSQLLTEFADFFKHSTAIFADLDARSQKSLIGDLAEILHFVSEVKPSNGRSLLTLLKGSPLEKAVSKRARD